MYLRSNPKWLDIGTDDADYADFVSNMDAGVLGKFYRANHYSRIADSLSFAQDELDNITPATDWEQVWKDVMQVYLNTWAQGVTTYNSHDQGVLDDAVSYNQNEFGPGVTMAHVMLDTDEDLDTVPNPYRFEGNPEDDNIIFPNPNDGNFLVDANGAFSFELFDLAGKELYKKNYPESSVRVFIPDQLPNGCYLYRVTQANGFSKSGLLNLLK